MKFRVTIEEHTFAVEIDNLQARPVLVTVDGETFAVEPESSTAPITNASEAPCPSPVQSVIRTVDTAAVKTIVAPIPGTIVGVHVKAGDKVTIGQELCTLEAMKMKNAIRANREGTLLKVFVANGDSVKHGQPLVEFSE